MITWLARLPGPSGSTWLRRVPPTTTSRCSSTQQTSGLGRRARNAAMDARNSVDAGTAGRSRRWRRRPAGAGRARRGHPRRAVLDRAWPDVPARPTGTDRRSGLPRCGHSASWTGRPPSGSRPPPKRCGMTRARREDAHRVTRIAPRRRLFDAQSLCVTVSGWDAPSRARARDHSWDDSSHEQQS